MVDYTITSLEEIIAYDIATGAWKFTLDELQSASLAQSQEKTDITGKQGRKLNSLKKNKALNVSGANGLVSTGLLSLQTGGDFKTEVCEIDWAETLIADASNEVTTSYLAIGTSGNEIKEVLVKDASGMVVSTLEQNASVSAGKFTYTPGTKKIKMHTDITEGTEVYVHYTRKITAERMINDSGKYSEKCRLIINAMCEDKCANIYRMQIEIPKADFDGNFTFDMGDNQTVHNFEAESLAGTCGNAGQFFTWTIFGVNTADYTDD